MSEPLSHPAQAHLSCGATSTSGRPAGGQGKQGIPRWRQGRGGILGVSFLLVVAGCSSFKTEVGEPLPTASHPLVEGETRVETVVHELGPPHAVSRLPGGFVFLYEYSRVDEFQWGISLEFLRLPYFKVVKGSSRLSESADLLVFDQHGILVAQGERAWRERLGGGGALQLIVSVLSLTDSTAFRRLPDPLLWGRGWLQRLPVVLNLVQDLRTGKRGLQQRIAPVFVGQATLEMSRPKPIKTPRQKTRR